MVIEFLRMLRHGQLRRFSKGWLFLGKIYRWFFRYLKLSKNSKHNIGPYGPFLLDGYFAFSDFGAWGGGHNNGFESCIEACRGANCFVDIGAHIGLVTLPAAKMLEGRGHVHAFEPSKVNSEFLRRHIAVNSFHNVTVSDLLVGEKNDFVDFFEANYPNGQNSKVITSRVDSYLKCKREQVTLDKYVAEKKIAPDIIKIDVEGAEISVLAGAKRTIKLFRPLIYLSVHPKELNETPEGLVGLKDIIREIGYQSFELNGSKVIDYRLAEYILKPYLR